MPDGKSLTTVLFSAKKNRDLGMVIMPFTHKSSGVLKEYGVRFFDEHYVSMRCRIFYFLMVILARDATTLVFPVFVVDQQIAPRSGRYGPSHN